MAIICEDFNELYLTGKEEEEVEFELYFRSWAQSMIEEYEESGTDLSELSIYEYEELHQVDPEEYDTLDEFLRDEINQALKERAK